MGGGGSGWVVLVVGSRSARSGRSLMGQLPSVLGRDRALSAAGGAPGRGLLRYRTL